VFHLLDVERAGQNVFRLFWPRTVKPDPKSLDAKDPEVGLIRSP
jgi:hypothetical protein